MFHCDHLPVKSCIPGCMSVNALFTLFNGSLKQRSNYKNIELTQRVLRSHWPTFPMIGGGIRSDITVQTGDFQTFFYFWNFFIFLRARQSDFQTSEDSYAPLRWVSRGLLRCEQDSLAGGLFGDCSGSFVNFPSSRRLDLGNFLQTKFILMYIISKEYHILGQSTFLKELSTGILRFFCRILMRLSYSLFLESFKGLMIL